MTVHRRILAILLLVAMLGVGPHTRADAHGASPAAASSPAPATATARWSWPFAGARSVAEAYRAPAHEYGAGHRGIDIVPTPDGTVRAPATGTVAFRGTVVDRPLLTIEHPGGYVSTFEPITSSLTPGEVVAVGDEIGAVSSGGHTPAGDMHLGVRLDGDYVNPMLLFGDVPRAVLLPCCEPL